MPRATYNLLSTSREHSPLRLGSELLWRMAGAVNITAGSHHGQGDMGCLGWEKSVNIVFDVCMFSGNSFCWDDVDFLWPFKYLITWPSSSGKISGPFLRMCVRFVCSRAFWKLQSGISMMRFLNLLAFVNCVVYLCGDHLTLQGPSTTALCTVSRAQSRSKWNNCRDLKWICQHAILFHGCHRLSASCQKKTQT